MINNGRALGRDMINAIDELVSKQWRTFVVDVDECARVTAEIVDLKAFKDNDHIFIHCKRFVR